MMTKTIFRWVAMGLSCGLLARSAGAAPDDLPCDKIQTQPALILEGEACLARETDAKKRTDMRAWITSHSFAVPRSEIKDEALLARADKRFGEAAKAPDTAIALTAPHGTKWALPSRKLASAGGYSILGSAISFCTTGGTRGHWDLTQKAVRSYRQWVKKDVGRFLAMSVVNVDDHAWLVPQAHAQTGTANGGLVPVVRATALKQFDDWIVDHATKMKGACTAAPRRLEQAAYELGILLHAAQDLATHAGITNPEHASLMLAGDNPDGRTPRLDTAQDWSVLVLQSARAYAGECIDAITNMNDEAHVETVALVQLGPIDAHEKEYADYVSSGTAFKAANAPSNHVVWFDGDQRAAADAFFKAHILAQLK